MKPSIAVIGYGYWGRNLIRNFHEFGVLKSICDSDPEKEVLTAEQYPDCGFTTDFDDVLRSDVHAVAISTPAASHYDMVRQALLAGKDVFVEKPLALTVADGENLIRLAHENQRILMVGHILRYHPAIVKLKKLIDDGELGQIRYIYSNRLNIGKIRTEENILWSFAPHDISVILALLNEEPVSVCCHGNAYLNHHVEDVTNTYIKFPSGVDAHIFVSWLHPFKEQRLVVIGAKKMAVFDDTSAQKLVIYPHQVTWKRRIPTAIKADLEVVPIDDAEPLRSELRHFLHCVENKVRPVTDGEEGLRVLRILNLCEKSLKFGSQFPVGDHHPARSPTPTPHPQSRREISGENYFVHESAYVDGQCEIGEGTKIWHFSHILAGARVGRNCVIGQNCCIFADVVVGNNVKIQNNVSVYTGVTLEDDVFLGPSCVLTNITNPRSQVNRHALYEKTVVRKGATIGANATIVCGIEIGRYAFVGAGAVVTKDVQDYALVIGNPAKQVGWMSRHGHRLQPGNENRVLVCPESGLRYSEIEPGKLRCIDLDEGAPLPGDLASGKKSYRDY